MSIQVRANNACGSTGWLSVNVPIDCWQWSQLIVSPNPSGGEVDITFENPEMMEAYFKEVKTPLKVVITNMTGEETYKGALTESGLHLNINDARSGIYLVRVFGKDFEHTSRLRLE